MILWKFIFYFTCAFVYSYGPWPSEDRYHYFLGNDTRGVFKQYHNWDPSQKLTNTPINNFIVAENGYVNDFKGTPLTAVAVWADDTHTPQQSFKIDESGEIQFDKGWCVSLLNDLAYMLNFTIKAINSSVYTSVAKDGTLSGPGGDITSGRADLIIGLQYVTTAMPVLRPIHPLGAYKISAFFRQPKIGGARNIYTQPFMATTWMVILVMLTFLAVSTLVCCFIEKKYFHENYQLRDSIVWICGIVLSQSFFDPATLPTRIIFISALGLILVVSNSYSAFLISSLATEYNPITTLKDLVTYKYQVIVQDRNNYTCEAFFPNNSIILKKYCGYYINENDSINKIYRDRTGRFAYVKSFDLLGVTARNMDYPNQEICTISGIVLPFKKPLTSMHGLRKSPLVSILNPKLLRLFERGVNARYSEMFDQQTVIKCAPTKFTYDPDVEVADVYVAFCVLSFGVVVACSLCLCEQWIRRMTKQKSQNEHTRAKYKDNFVRINEFTTVYTNWKEKTQFSYKNN